jgi:TPR repeat protein
MLLQSIASKPVTTPSVEQGIAALKKRAEAGDPKAQVQLGTAYASGDGVTEDDAEAVKWFRRAADQADAAGEYFLGEMYATGRGGWHSL